MKIYFGSDHGGFELKEKLKKWFAERDLQGIDFGASALNKGDDFVDYTLAVVENLQNDFEGRGVLLCRNGVGVSIAANRFAGIRCALGFDKKQVERARRDDDVNCLALPADYIDFKKAKELVEAFLKTEFSNESKYQRRVAKLEMIGNVGGSCCGGGGGCGGGCGDEGCGDGCC